MVIATELHVFPAKIELNGSVDEELCSKVKISSDYEGNIIVRTKWARKDTKNINDYYLDAESIGINEYFNKKLNIENTKEETFCLTAEKSGKYYGALLYNTENSYAGVGIWITVNIQGDEAIENKMDDKITGRVIKDSETDFDYKQVVYAFPTAVLFFGFLFLLRYYKRKKNAGKGKKLQKIK